MAQSRIVLEDVEDIEVQLLIDGVFHRYGYDFRDYSRAHMKRRIMHRMSKENFSSISQLQERVLHDDDFFKSVLPEFSINVTEMFRDPSFFAFFRENIIPILKDKDSIRVWHAGCATGEEVYSMSILLKESGLYDRATIFASDFNDQVLNAAKEGIFPIASAREYTNNYRRSGGKRVLEDYYEASYDRMIMDDGLKKNMRFVHHNLVSDDMIMKMDVILCRNVLIYFNRDLQNRVLKLFDSSMDVGGVLCLGTKETIDYSDISSEYQTLEQNLRIYRKHRNR